MAEKRITRRIQLFALHAQGMSYEEIFVGLSRLGTDRRIVNVQGLIIGFLSVEQIDGGFFIRAIQGDAASDAVVFNTQRGTARDGVLASDEVFGEITHLFVLPRERRAAIEYVRRGAKALTISAAIEALAQREGVDFRLEFVPALTEDFIREINRFSRIREAAISMVRPNASWSDHYNRLSGFMEESGGDRVDLDVKAGRGGALSKDKGIVEAIKEVASDGQPYLHNAKIVGTRTGESGESSLNSRSHIAQTTVSLPTTDAKVPSTREMLNKLIEFLKSQIAS